MAGDPDPLLSIGVFARRSRLSMKALRLYDPLGLLPPAKVDSGNGIGGTGRANWNTTRLVVMLRRLDMPLAEVAEIVSEPGELGASRLAAYWEGVEHRFAGQRELAAFLQGKLLGEEGTLGIFEVRERSVPEQVVLTEQRHTLVDQLSCWIGMAMPRLMEHGGVLGSPFVVYYGVVDEDNDGPVEICVPIDPSVAGAADLATRREPAHRQVYVRLRKAQVEFPQILSPPTTVSRRGSARTGWSWTDLLARSTSPTTVRSRRTTRSATSPIRSREGRLGCEAPLTGSIR